VPSSSGQIDLIIHIPY